MAKIKQQLIMKKLLKIKTLAICAILLAGIIFPTILTAQRSDGFFKSGNEDLYENREGEINGITAPYFGNKPAPLGGGLLVLAAAGTCYAVTRRKRSLRKGTMLLLALAIVLGTTQCKKRIETVTTNGGDSILLTLKVNNGGKHHIDPSTLGTDYVPIYFDAKTNTTHGDYIYVGNGSNYIGTLECIVPSDYYGNGAVFQGTISGVNNDDVLHFYFVGGLTPSKTLEAGTTTDFTVDISNQSSKLPVLSYTTAVYNGSNSISCNLHNKCALVEFKFTTPTIKKVKISNMYSEAKIDFTQPGFTPTEKLDAITLYKTDNTRKWAVLMLGKERYSMGMVYNRTDSYEGDIDIYDYYDGVTIPELTESNNYFYGSSAISVNNSETNKNNRVFVVSENGNVVVQFAPGNLMYKKSTGTWSFMTHQYDVIEKAATEVGEDYALKDTVNHFGWGCTGFQDLKYNTSQEYYLPYSTNHNNANANYGPTGLHYLSVMNQSDWGAVANEGNLGGHDDWRLLTQSECAYLLKYRYNANGKRGTVQIYKSNVDPYYQNGAVFFPDDWENTIGFITTASAWNNNVYSNFTALEALLESTGALYLPGAGYREVTSGLMKVKSINSSGNYWLSSCGSNITGDIWYVSGSSGLDVKIKSRSLGFNVRLVR